MKANKNERRELQEMAVKRQSHTQGVIDGLNMIISQAEIMKAGYMLTHKVDVALTKMLGESKIEIIGKESHGKKKSRTK